MTLGNLGTFGDSFNVITSLFTGLAFAGVIISVILQTQELKEARDEFRGQKEALEKQQTEMVIQSFDNKFFQMLNLFNNTINNLHLSVRRGMMHEYEDYNKKEVLKYIKEYIESKIKSDNINNLNEFQSLFNDINNKFDTTFKYYFINLYQILKYIDINSNIEDEPKEYTNIVRAQLSKDELVLLFYNAIGVKEFSQDNYQILVEEYELFEHLRYDDLNSDDENHIIDLLLSAYKEKAFGKNESLKQKRVEILKEKDNKTLRL